MAVSWSTDDVRSHPRGARRSHSVAAVQSLSPPTQSSSSSPTWPRKPTVSLPPIKAKKQPKSFDDLYAMAKVRVSKRSAMHRSGGRNPNVGGAHLNELPALPKAAKAVEVQSVEETQWAAAALEQIPSDEVESVVPSRMTTPPDSRAMKVRRASMAMRKSITEDEVSRRLDAAEEKEEAVASDELQEVLQRLEAEKQGEGFSERELSRLTTAFNRFKVPGSADLHINDVPDLLGYLGRVITGREKVMPLLEKVTSYDYVDFDEFLEFMMAFNAMEYENFREVFYEFDTDKSGEISVQELRAITSALGFLPLRKMIVEALSVVDRDSNGQLNFEEFVTFLTVYRHAEGFTRAEVAELRESFEKFAVKERGELLLPPEALRDALVKVFGLQVSIYAEQMGALLASGQGLQKSSLAANDGGEPECLSFSEFLIFGRKIREDQLKSFEQDYAQGWGGSSGSNSKPGSRQDRLIREELSAERAEFNKHDLNKDGKISESELRVALEKYRYTPLRQVLAEVFEEVLDAPWTPEYEMSFNEFFDFMLLLRHRDGFLRSEVQAFRQIFQRFDDDGSGEISALELSDLMRFMGYTSGLDLMHSLVIQVDKNESGCLDFQEFLHLMRLYREEELHKIKSVYSQYMDKGTGKMSGKFLMQCMQELGYDHKELVSLHGERLKMLHGGEVDFDALVQEMDLCRSAKVAKQRKKAGFSNEELENFKSLFEVFDRDSSGHIDNLELIELLKFFNWQPRSKEQQQILMGKLDIARGRAREAGIEDVGEEGSADIKFWAFVQLARMLKREMEHAEEERVSNVVKELKLSDKECEQFRVVFRGAIRHQKQRYEEAGPQEREALMRSPEYGLRADSVWLLVRSLGVHITARVEERLQLEMVKFMEDGVLSFTGFLRLMMWMVGSNFAGINEATARFGSDPKKGAPE